MIHLLHIIHYTENIKDIIKPYIITAHDMNHVLLYLGSISSCAPLGYTYIHIYIYTYVYIVYDVHIRCTYTYVNSNLLYFNIEFNR